MDNLPSLPPPPKHPTLLSLALSTSPPSQWPTIIDNIDWMMPDVGRAYTIMYGNQWGSEMVHVHPLSTLARYVDEETFRQCLDKAHVAQPKDVLFKMGQRADPVDLADWVASGVLSAVARHGSPTMLKDLVTKLGDRAQETANIDRPGGFDRIPNPFQALALAEGATDYKKKIKLIIKLAKDQAEQTFGYGSSAWARRAARQTEKQMYSLALHCAIAKGNSSMVDAVLTSGRATMAVDTMINACGEATLSLAVRAAQALNWSIAWGRASQEVPSLWSNLSALSWMCVARAHDLPRTEEQSRYDRYQYKDLDPAIEHPSATRLACHLLTVLPQQLKEDKDLSRALHGFGDKLTSSFMGLDSAQVEDVWQQQKTLAHSLADDYKDLDLYWFPETNAFMNMAQVPENPWVQRVLRGVSELTPDQATTFMQIQGRRLQAFWDNLNVHTLREGMAVAPVPGVALWWSRLPAGTTQMDMFAWMEAQAHSKPDNVQTIRQALLEAAAESSGPAARTRLVPRHM